jgi:hypothetical protein
MSVLAELLPYLAPSCPPRLRRLAELAAQAPIAFDRHTWSEYLIDGQWHLSELATATGLIHEACARPARPVSVDGLVGRSVPLPRRAERAKARIDRAVGHLEQVSPGLARALRAGLFLRVDEHGRTWVMFRPAGRQIEARDRRGNPCV